MTLSEVAELSRKSIRWAIIGLIAIFILKFTWDTGVSYWEATHPEPPPKPTVAFGKLPAINLPPTLVSLPNLNLTLETVTGKVPEVPLSLSVFVMPHPQPNLLNTENAKKIASAFGFKSEPAVNSKTDYRWSDPSLPNESFKINPLNGNFEYRYNYLANPTILEKTVTISKEEAVNVATSFINSRVSLPKDLAGTTASAAYIKISNGVETEVSSPSESNAIRVSIFRKELEIGSQKYPLFTPHPKLSLVRIVISPADDKRVFSVNYVYWPIEEGNSATYPIKTGTEAWEEVQKGFGTLVYTEKPNLVSGAIQEISLAYFDDEQAQNYLQPIYVFSGIGFTKDGVRSPFAIYLPAITREYIGQE